MVTWFGGVGVVYDIIMLTFVIDPHFTQFLGKQFYVLDFGLSHSLKFNLFYWVKENKGVSKKKKKISLSKCPLVNYKQNFQ